MPRIIEGTLNAAPYKFGIAVSRFNELITRRLLDGALDCLKRHGADDSNIQIVYCPGAFELPQVARKLTASGSFDAVIVLGCVIQGETPHFEYVSSAATSGTAKVAADSGVPVALGILTTDSLEQAIERAGAKAGNKGWDAAISAIELADVFKQLSHKRSK